MSISAADPVDSGVALALIERFTGSPPAIMGEDNARVSDVVYIWPRPWLTAGRFTEDPLNCVEIAIEKATKKIVSLRGLTLDQCPRNVFPTSDLVLRHYPRIVDFRWEVALIEGFTLSQMQFEVEISKENGADDWVIEQVLKADVPFYSLIMHGDNEYRWRVRQLVHDNKGKVTYATEFSEAGNFKFDTSEVVRPDELELLSNDEGRVR